MIDSLLPPDLWAQNEFGSIQLGDKRCNKRIMKIAERLVACPSGTLPLAFPNSAELKAAYRFFEHGRGTFDLVLAPHVERVRNACRQPGVYLIIEDTTCLDYSSHRATKDLGIIGDGCGRGFDLHSALAVRVEGWTLDQRPEGSLVGLFDQQCRSPRPAPKGETRGERLSRPRKSQVWAAGVKTAGCPPLGCQWIYEADCESDFYEPIQICHVHQMDFVIRSCQDRRLAGENGHLYETLDRAAVIGQTTVKVRSRGGQPARTATVEIRSVRVDLGGAWRPGGKLPPLKGIGVIEVKEVKTPDGVSEPLHWILLTSLPCATLADALRAVGYYTARWWIEEYHKALKTGAGVEKSQLEHGYRLESLIAVLALVAVRLLSTKMLARSRPESFEAATSFGPQILAILEQKLGKPQAGWTNQALMIAIARLGGFIGRKSDGIPGWQTIWRGWQRLMWMAEGVSLIQRE